MTANGAPQNRLSIANLMLWTLGTAIALGLYRLSGRYEQLEGVSATWRLYALVYCLLAGPKIGGLFLFAGRLVSRRHEVPLQPGHWLLWIEGLSTILVYTAQVAVFAIFRENVTGAVGAGSQLPNCVITAALYLLAHTQQSNISGPWKFTFVVLFLQHAFAGYMNLLSALWISGSGLTFLPYYSGPSICCLHVGLLIPLLVAASLDPERARRDYLHWAGVVTVAGTEVAQLIMRFTLG